MGERTRVKYKRSCSSLTPASFRVSPCLGCHSIQVNSNSSPSKRVPPILPPPTPSSIGTFFKESVEKERGTGWESLKPAGYAPTNSNYNPTILLPMSSGLRNFAYSMKQSWSLEIKVLQAKDWTLPYQVPPASSESASTSVSLDGTWAPLNFLVLRDLRLH